MSGSMLHVIRNLLLFLQPCVAAGAPSPLAGRAAFTSIGRPHSPRKRSRCGVPFHLQVQTSRQKNPLMEMVADVALRKKSSSGNIDSVEDFDADLATEIQAALDSAGVVDNDIIDGNTVDGDDVHDATNQTAHHDVSIEDTNASEQRQIVQPPVKNEAPQNAPKMPPHTALAQVLANQCGIDIASVPPSSGSKITAEDVEFYAWKIAQPPCTQAALKLAYSLDLDLNELYDEEVGELQLSDVQLYHENLRSLQMTSQTKKGKKSSGKKSKRTKALDEHLEQGIGKLSQRAKRLADTVAGGIVQQVKSQTQKIQSSATETLRVGEIFADTNGLTKNGDITSVEDFDTDLASAIQEALSSVDLDVNGEGAADATSVEASSDSPAREVEVDVDVNGMANGDMVEDFDRADGKSEEEVPSTIPSRELLESMTCASLKDQLRARGLKVSGKKEELVSRLVNNMDEAMVAAASAAAAEDAEDDDDRGGGSPLFFATLQ